MRLATRAPRWERCYEIGTDSIPRLCLSCSDQRRVHAIWSLCGPPASVGVWCRRTGEHRLMDASAGRPLDVCAPRWDGVWGSRISVVVLAVQASDLFLFAVGGDSLMWLGRGPLRVGGSGPLDAVSRWQAYQHHATGARFRHRIWWWSRRGVEPRVTSGRVGMFPRPMHRIDRCSEAP